MERREAVVKWYRIQRTEWEGERELTTGHTHDIVYSLEVSWILEPSLSIFPSSYVLGLGVCPYPYPPLLTPSWEERGSGLVSRPHLQRSGEFGLNLQATSVGMSIIGMQLVSHVCME